MNAQDRVYVIMVAEQWGWQQWNNQAVSSRKRWAQEEAQRIEATTGKRTRVFSEVR